MIKKKCLKYIFKVKNYFWKKKQKKQRKREVQNENLHDNYMTGSIGIEGTIANNRALNAFR